MSSEVNPYSPSRDVEPTQASSDREGDVAEFVPPQRRRMLAIVALAFSILLAGACLVCNVELLGLYAVEEELIDADRETVLLARINGLFVALMVARLATAPLFIAWMYRVHCNLPALGHRELDSKPIWVIVCWFVPIMNLFCPYQVMREIWVRSAPQAAPSEDSSSAILVICWWSAWIGMIGLAAWGNFLDRSVTTLEGVVLATWADIAHLIAIMVAGVLLICIVTATDLRQLRRYQEALH